jgi:putative hydrolase of the HAD superfamily
VGVCAVIFDWGGTLTPWHNIDQDELWRAVCGRHDDAGLAAQTAARLRAAEQELWELAEREHRSATLDEVFSRAGVQATEALLATYFEAWDPHTFTDPGAAELLRGLRERGIKIGVLSNTMWPRDQHERIFSRDGVLELIDGAVYSSEIAWTKPHPEAVRAAMAAIGVTSPAECVYVGDRPFDDMYGAHRAGMRTVLIPNSDVPGYEGVAPDAVVGRIADLLDVIDRW